MKCAGMPFGMWMLFAGSFQKQLTAVLGYDTDISKAITKKAKSEYRRIIAGLPEFEKGDHFQMKDVYKRQWQYCVRCHKHHGKSRQCGNPCCDDGDKGLHYHSGDHCHAVCF